MRQFVSESAALYEFSQKFCKKEKIWKYFARIRSEFEFDAFKHFSRLSPVLRVLIPGKSFENLEFYYSSLKSIHYFCFSVVIILCELHLFDFKMSPLFDWNEC